VVKLVQPAQHGPFDDHTDGAYYQRCHDQSRPVIEMKIRHPDQGTQLGVAKKSHIGTQHIERTVGKVDDIQQTENHRQPQAQNGVEHAVVEPQHNL